MYEHMFHFFTEEIVDQEIISDTMRTAVSLVDAMSDKYSFMGEIQLEKINHEEFITLILQLIGIFEDSPEISKLRVTFNGKCLGKFAGMKDGKDQELQRTCVRILYSYVSIEKQRDLIMGKLINLVKKAEILNDRDVSKKVELDQLVAALTSVQKRRKSILISWLDKGLINRPNYDIKCTLFNCMELDLLPKANIEEFKNYLTHNLKLTIDVKDCGEGKLHF